MLSPEKIVCFKNSYSMKLQVINKQSNKLFIQKPALYTFFRGFFDTFLVFTIISYLINSNKEI